MWSEMRKQNIQAKKVCCAHLCPLGIYEGASPCAGAFVIKGLPRGDAFVFLYIYIFTVLLKRKIYDTPSISAFP